MKDTVALTVRPATRRLGTAAWAGCQGGRVHSGAGGARPESGVRGEGSSSDQIVAHSANYQQCAGLTCRVATGTPFPA
jgi:hypothetical protein